MNPWLTLSPSDFEELIYHVLGREGFHNVTWYGSSGRDSGRDITCERTELLGTRVFTRQCVVQCKRYKGTVGRSRLFDDLAKVTQFSPNYFILATTGIINASTKDWLAAQGHFGFSVVLWERTDLDVMLGRHQDLRARFLNIASDDTFVLRRLAANHTILASIGDWPIETSVRALIGASWDLALKCGSALSTAHLLLAMLESTQSILSRVVQHFTDITLSNARYRVADLVAAQTKVPLGAVAVTPSYVSAIESSHIFALTSPAKVLSEKLVCWFIIDKNSNSTRTFLQILGINPHEIKDFLLTHYFDPNERRALTLHAKHIRFANIESGGEATVGRGQH